VTAQVCAIEVRSKAVMLTALDVDPAMLDQHEQRFVAGIFKSCHAALLPASKRHYQDHPGWSRWSYGCDDFACAQLIWTDRDGRFPWQHGYATEFIEAQPDLTDGAWSG
jgi:hypothetical protein